MRGSNSIYRVGGLLLCGLTAWFALWSCTGRVQEPVQLFLPEDGSLGVRGPLSLAFPAEVVHSSAESSLVLSPETPGKFAWEGRILSFFPTWAWQSGTQITVELLSGVKMTGGESLPGYRRWQIPIRDPQIIYLHPAGEGAQVWVGDQQGAGGERRALTSHEGGVLDFSVSPDGQEIAYSAFNSAGGYDLWRVESSEGGAELLLGCGPDWCLESVYSPDGKIVAYSRYSSGAEQGSLAAAGEIGFIHPGTKSRVDFAGVSSFSGKQPGWSPDGGYLTFYDPSGSGIRLVERESGQQTLLAGIPGETGSWSPDGKRIIYPLRQEAGLQPATQLVIAALDTRKIKALETPPGTLEEFSTPAWSPDGDWIALSRRLTGGTFGGQIWLYALDGSAALQVSEDATYHYARPRWNPAGRKLVFQRTASGSSSASPEVVLWDQDTRKSILISEDAYLAEWLP